VKQTKSDAARRKTVRRGRVGKAKAGLTGITLMASVEEPEHPYVSIEKVLGLYKPRKKKVTLRVDADVLEWFRQDGEGYQTRINRALRRVMRLEMKERE
jgi:uncharacterized protein (DUF4415 family)